MSIIFFSSKSLQSYLFLVNIQSISLVFRPIHRFLKAYLLKGGFRDGLPGFIFACLEAYYQLIMVAKLCEQQKQLKVEEPTSKVSKIIVISKFTTQNAQTVSINHVALP